MPIFNDITYTTTGDYTAKVGGDESLLFNAVPDNQYINTRVVIPSVVTFSGKRYIVTKIGIKAFAYCHVLPEIIIPNSVSEICQEAFYGCHWIKYIRFEPASQLTTIGAYAFFNLIHTTRSIALPFHVSSIGNYAFSNSTIKDFTYCGITVINDQSVFLDTKLSTVNVRSIYPKTFFCSKPTTICKTCKRLFFPICSKNYRSNKCHIGLTSFMLLICK